MNGATGQHFGIAAPDVSLISGLAPGGASTQDRDGENGRIEKRVASDARAGACAFLPM
jgi:hypothetical protein